MIFSSILLIIISVSGCVNLPEIRKPPMTLYYLEVLPLTEFRAQNPRKRLNWQLTIEEPCADTRFDSDYVIVDSGESKVNYVKDIRWVTRLPLLVQEVFITLFEQSSVVKGVGDPSEGIDSDYILLTDIKSFQLKVGSKPSTSIQIYGRLMRASDRELLAAKLFSVDIPVASETPKDVMAGFVMSINEVTRSMIDWVYEEGIGLSVKF